VTYQLPGQPVKATHKFESLEEELFGRPKRVRRGKIDINTMTDEERVEYWNNVSEAHMFGLYKTPTVKFVREKAQQVTNRFYNELGKLSVHEVGCAYSMTLRWVHPEATFLGTDPAENMIKACRIMYEDRPNTTFEVDSIESGHVKYRHDLVTAFCMMDSLSHEYSMKLIPMAADMCERAFLFTSLRHEKNNSLVKPNWSMYRNFNSHDPEEIVELADKNGFDCELDVRDKLSNFAALWIRR